jgi:hypothetical protein
MGEVWLLQVVAVVAVHPAGPRNTHAVTVHSAGPRNTHPTAAGAHAIVMVKNSLTAVPVSQFECFKTVTLHIDKDCEAVSVKCSTVTLVILSIN